MSRTNVLRVNTESKSKIIPRIPQIPESTDKICRICMEKEDSSPMINPCKCIGSVKYVHESCLKSWLLTHKKTSKRIHCEICKTQFQIDLKFSKKCIFWNRNKAKSHFFYLPLIVTVMISLLLIIYLIASNSIALKGNNKLEYKIVILILCSFFSIIFLFLTISLIKDTCVVIKLDQWTIKSGLYDKEELNSKENFDETCVREGKIGKVFSDEKLDASGKIKDPIRLVINTSMIQYSRKYSDEFMIGKTHVTHKYSTSQPCTPLRDNN